MGREHGVHTFETSAKTGHNVDSAFACLIYQVLKPCLAVAEQMRLDSANDTSVKASEARQTEHPLPALSDLTHTQLNLIRALSDTPQKNSNLIETSNKREDPR